MSSNILMGKGIIMILIMNIRDLYNSSYEMFSSDEHIIEYMCKIHMPHFSYTCKMRYPLDLVLENSEYLWFY